MVAEDTLITETSRTDQPAFTRISHKARNNRTDYISLRKCNSSPVINALLNTY